MLAGTGSIWDGRASKLQQKFLRHAKAEEKVRSGVKEERSDELRGVKYS